VVLPIALKTLMRGSLCLNFEQVGESAQYVVFFTLYFTIYSGMEQTDREEQDISGETAEGSNSQAGLGFSLCKIPRKLYTLLGG